MRAFFYFFEPSPLNLIFLSGSSNYSALIKKSVFYLKPSNSCVLLKASNNTNKGDNE